MPLDKDGLLDFIGLVDEELASETHIIAVGGTAMTLLGLKSSTIDVDIDFPKREDLTAFDDAVGRINPGFRIDRFLGSQIFSVSLPPDYDAIALPVVARKHFKHVRAFALHPLDIIATKVGRLNDRDVEDIKTCIEAYGLTRKQVEKRGISVEEAGNERVYRDNLNHVLEKFF